MPRRCLAVLAAALTLLTGCVGTGIAGGRTRDGQLAVVAGFYPLAFLAGQIGGPAVHVIDLTPPGVEPHDVELTARQVARIEDAALVVYLRGLAPAVDSAVGDARHRLDLGSAAQGRHGDPHVWLDPQRMVAMAEVVGAELARVDATNADAYGNRMRALVGELTDLDRALRAGLAHCARTEVITSHSAFGYLTARYGLTQVGITGVTPDAEPRPGRLAEVTRIAKSHHATTIYFESIVSPKVAEAVARSVGASTAVLDPIETEPAGGDYLSAMRANLAALRQGLDCR